MTATQTKFEAYARIYGALSNKLDELFEYQKQTNYQDEELAEKVYRLRKDAEKARERMNVWARKYAKELAKNG